MTSGGAATPLSRRSGRLQAVAFPMSCGFRGTRPALPRLALDGLTRVRAQSAPRNVVLSEARSAVFALAFAAAAFEATYSLVSGTSIILRTDARLA